VKNLALSPTIIADSAAEKRRKGAKPKKEGGTRMARTRETLHEWDEFVVGFFVLLL
jgi:hypothetical protein